MKTPFRRKRNGIVLTFEPAERAVLAQLPEYLSSLGPAGEDPAAGRFQVTAYPQDPEADAEFRRLVATDLDRARLADRERFAETLTEGKLGDDDAEAWLRVLGDARLLLGTRMGLDESAWEDDRLGSTPEGAMLQYLSYLQDSLVGVLSAALPEAGR